MPKFKLDYSYLMADWLGEGGISTQEISGKKTLLDEIYLKIQKQQENKELGFLNLLNTDLGDIKNLAKRLGDKFDTLVVCGIGGSDLGAKAITNALGVQNQKKLYFTGDTTDPNEIRDLLSRVNLKTTAFNIVSKSGSTIETASFFLFLWKTLLENVGRDKLDNHFILTTDPNEGPLRKIANSHNIHSLSIPENVGGRFSVLSPVGLFPAAFFGINIDKIIEGAKDEQSENEKADSRRALFFALTEHLFWEKGRHISILFPYSKKLKEFGAWFRQLWAESLGKAKDQFGNYVHFGITPEVAMGPADQHSQIQLFMEGPNDKLITFIRIEDFGLDYEIPKSEWEEFSYLSSQKFSKLTNIEQEATALALLKNNRPSRTIVIDKLDEETLGALFYFFEMAVVYLSQLAQVNAFDQPAVEEGKNIMFSYLGRKGYEEKKKEIVALKKGKPQYII